MPPFTIFLAFVALFALCQPSSALPRRTSEFSNRGAPSGRPPRGSSTPAPHSLQARADDCRLRSFTADYVAFLAQMPVTGNWSTAARAALQLESCAASLTTPLPTRARPQWSQSERARLLRHGALDGAPSADCQWEVFVSPDGSDADTGAASSPLRTIQEALFLSRQVRRRTPYLHSPGQLPLCITLREGVYYLGSNASTAFTAYDSRVGAIHLTPADSGLTIRAQAGEKVVLSGGVPLTLDWQPWHTSPPSFYAALNASLIPALDRWHFNELYADERRCIRAKFPNGDPAIHGLWDHVGWTERAKAWTKPLPSVDAMEVHIASPARTGTHFPRYQIGIGGPASVFNPPQSFWATGNAPAGDTYKVPSGVTLDAATAERAKRWGDPTTGSVFAFHSGHWGSWAFDIAAFDNSTASLTFGRGGFQEARGAAAGAEFYVAHVLEELDNDLEFFVDYAARRLYFQPANGTAPEVLVASQLPCILSMQGEVNNPVRDVSIVGVTFAHSASTYMRDYEVPSGGDWSVHRGGAVFLDNTADVLIARSTFTNLGGNALVLSNYHLRPTVAFSEFVWLGESAVVLLGSVSGIDAVTNTQQPVDALIVGCLMHELGAYIKQTAAVVQFLSLSTAVSKCAMFNLPRAGINLNDGFGGGLNITGNVIFNAVRETSDHGPINSWDRQPYLVPQPGNSSGTLTPAWSYITANLLFNAYASTWPIDHDDGSCYYLDSHNVLVYGGAKNYLGHSKINSNQLYIFPDGQRFDDPSGRLAQSSAVAAIPAAWGSNCAQYFSPSPNDSNWGEFFFNNTCVMQSMGEVIGFPFGGCDVSTPSQQSVMPHTANNTFILPSDTRFHITCNQKGSAQNLTLAEWQAAGFDANSVEVLSSTNILAGVLAMAAQLLGMNQSQPLYTLQ